MIRATDVALRAMRLGVIPFPNNPSPIPKSARCLNVILVLSSFDTYPPKPEKASELNILLRNPLRVGGPVAIFRVLQRT